MLRGEHHLSCTLTSSTNLSLLTCWLVCTEGRWAVRCYWSTQPESVAHLSTRKSRLGGRRPMGEMTSSLLARRASSSLIDSTVDAISYDATPSPDSHLSVCSCALTLAEDDGGDAKT